VPAEAATRKEAQPSLTEYDSLVTEYEWTRRGEEAQPSRSDGRAAIDQHDGGSKWPAKKYGRKESKFW